MAWVLTLGAAIVSAVSAAVAVVASVVAVLATAVFSVLAYVIGAVWSFSGGVVIGIAEGVGLIGTTTAINAMASLHMINTMSVLVYSHVATFVSAIATNFKAFLTAIHFNTLMQINNLAYLVSSDYRKMMSKVYGELAKFSNAIGVGSQFVTLAIRNARNVVLDVSTMLGRGYDIAEVAWLNEMNNFFSIVNVHAKQIANDPYYLLELIDLWIYKPALNLKGQTVQGIFTTIRNALDGLEGLVENVDKVRDDFQQLYDDLPTKIQEKLDPFMEAVIEPINDFIDDVYTPELEKVNLVLDAFDERLNDKDSEVKEITDRLKKPGDLLAGIHELSLSERETQRNIMFETVNNQLIQFGQESNELSKETDARLIELTQEYLKGVPAVTWAIKEAPPTTEPKLGEQDESDSWFVGDY